MAKCPKDKKGWTPLVEKMQGSKMKAYSAFLKNGGVIPDLGSEIVQRILAFKMNTGDKITEEVDSEGVKTGYYVKDKDSSYQLNRTTDYQNGFIRHFSPFARKEKNDLTYGENKANKFFEGVEEGSKLVSDYNNELVTKEEYIKQVDTIQEAGRIKGIAIHKGIEAFLNPDQRDSIYNEVDDLVRDFHIEYGEETPIRWEWIKDDKVASKMLENAGANTHMVFDNAVEDDILRDVIHSEVKVSNDLLGFGGTLDTMIEKSNGKYIISDWKTGMSYNPASSNNMKLLMKYGDQASREILNNNMNEAKIQTLFYAFMLKLNNPSMEFEDINVAWIPNRSQASNPKNTTSVDTKAFLGMFEAFFKDEAAMKEAGYPKDMYNKIIEQSPRAFEPRDYSSKVSESLEEELITSEDSPDIILSKKIQRLNTLIGKNFSAAASLKSRVELDDLTEDEKAEVFTLHEEILRMNSDGAVDMFNLDKVEDMGIFSLWFGNMADTNNPLVQEYKKFHDRQVRKKLDIQLQKEKEFQALLSPVLNEYKKNVFGFRNFRNYDYAKVYAKFYVEEKSPYGEGVLERFIHDSETDPELKSRYDSLTKNEKALIDYMNKTFEELFNEDSYMQKEAFKSPSGKSLNHLEVYNHNKGTGDKFNYQKGFFFKVPITTKEMKQRFGWDRAIRSYFKMNLTYFIEDQFEQELDNQQAVPIKYLGNKYVNSSKLYTKNIESIFSNGLGSILDKEYLDPSYSVGTALSSYLSLNQHGDQFENTAKFLDIKLMQNVQKRMMRTKWSRRGVKYTDRNGIVQTVSIDKMIRLLMNWVSATTMWLKPLQGIGNGTHATLLTHRDALKGSITANLKGFDTEGIDFTLKDIAKAEKEYLTYMKDAIQGNLRANKMLLMAQKFDYFGSNYEYATLDKFAMAERFKGVDQSSLYMFHSMPEEFVSMTTMTAQMMHTVNKTTGKSLWDSYTPVQKAQGVYELEWTGGTRGSIKHQDAGKVWYEELTELNAQEIAKVKRVHERLQGGYRSDEATGIEVYIWGKAIMQFKKYLPRLVINLLHGRKISTDLGYYKRLFDSEGQPVMTEKDGTPIPVMEWHARVEEGRFRSLTVALSVILGRRSKTDMIDVTRENLTEALLTAGMMAFFGSIYVLLFGDVDDDDTMKKWWKMYLVDNLSQQYNVVDLLRTMKTAPTPALITKSYQTTESLLSVLTASANYAVGNEDAALTKQGDLRGWNMFKKNIPYIASGADFLSKLDNTKSQDDFIDWWEQGVRFK